MLLGKRKSFENIGCANERKYGNDKIKVCSSIIENHWCVIQGYFSQRGKIRGSWMGMVIIFLIFFASVVHINSLEPAVYVALKS